MIVNQQFILDLAIALLKIVWNKVKIMAKLIILCIPIKKLASMILSISKSLGVDPLEKCTSSENETLKWSMP